MANKRKSAARARRRNAERKAANAARRVQKQNVEVKLQYARHKTELELLLNRGCLGPTRMKAPDKDAAPKDRYEKPLGDERYDAGDRFYRDWRTAGGEPRLVASYEGDTVRSANGGHAEHQVAARLRFERALASVNRRCRPVLIHVVLLDQKLSDWPGGPVSEALPMLRDALDDLIAWREAPRRKIIVDGPVVNQLEFA